MILPEISENNFLKEPKKIIFRFIFTCLLLMNLKVCNGKLFKCEQRWHSGNGLWSNIVKKKKKSWFVHLHQQLVLFIFYLCLCLQLLLAKKKISEPEGLKVGIFPLLMLQNDKCNCGYKVRNDPEIAYRRGALALSCMSVSRKVW